MNVILTEQNGKVVRAQLGHGVYADRDGDLTQATEICKNEEEAARHLLAYYRAVASARDIRQAEEILSAT